MNAFRTLVSNQTKLYSPLFVSSSFQFSRFFSSNNAKSLLISEPFKLGSVIELNEGNYFELSRTFTDSDVETFANLVGDHNPIHKPENKRNVNNNNNNSIINSPYGNRPIVHGWLTSSLFGNIFGQMIPGAIYLNQTVTFRKPVFFNEKITAIVTVKDLSRSSKGLVGCDTILKNSEGSTVVEGSALVMVKALKQAQKII